MSDAAADIDRTIARLTEQVAALRGEAGEQGFKHLSVTIEYDLLNSKPSVRVWMAHAEPRSQGQGLTAPSAEAAVEELARRLDWERDVNMRLIGNEAHHRSNAQ